MYPYRIQPITVGRSSAQLQVHLLWAARFLQIPEGRAFLLYQLSRRDFPLAHVFAFGRARLRHVLGDAREGGAQYPMPAAVLDIRDRAAPLNQPGRPSVAPSLDLDWPRETGKEEVTVLVYEAYQAAPVIVSGNLFEVFI